MSDYIDRQLVCYQLAKRATVDGQPRAIRRAARIVEEFPASDVRNVVYCKDCAHWDAGHQTPDKTGGSPVAYCSWFSRQGAQIQTSSNDFCSYGCAPGRR